jgi:hypothetical protein
MLLGRTCVGVFHTGWLPDHATAPAKGKLIEEMSGDLLVGILTEPGKPPIAVIVDKRVDKDFGAIPEREVEVRFADAVTESQMPSETRSTADSSIKLRLPGGGGQILVLKGGDLPEPVSNGF